MKASVLVVCDDVLFWSKIEGAARAAGVRSLRAQGAEDASRTLAGGDVRRVLVDLEATSLDPFACASQWKSAAGSPEVIAFCSHVDVRAQARARQAGFDRVLARSAFVRELPSLVRLPPGDPAPPGSSRA